MRFRNTRIQAEQCDSRGNELANPRVDAIEHQQEFVFIVVANPRLDAGAPIPAGAVQIDVFPKLVVGIPR